MDEMPVSCGVTKDHTIDTIVHADAQVIRCPFSRRHFIESCLNSVAQFDCTYDHELIMHLNCNNTSS
ncbi:unnamed protein product, partial [Onchocerca ochengi]|uniref:CHHC U11-48K-type domain-containing protein n=1 Tax=Onchocerca ochengi TaxID=42157 RepID=A0A182EY32_ONCOC